MSSQRMQISRPLPYKKKLDVMVQLHPSTAHRSLLHNSNPLHFSFCQIVFSSERAFGFVRSDLIAFKYYPK